MSCADCEAAQYVGPYDDPKAYYVRVGTGNLMVKGCKAHVAQLIDRLRGNLEADR
jgi:hypothetical protein